MEQAVRGSQVPAYAQRLGDRGAIFHDERISKEWPRVLEKEIPRSKSERSKKHLLLKGQRMDLEWQVFSSKML